ncbi:HK97 gp10 family phage protein [Clostridium sp. HBUAS56010]|uniref:HK97 gp10 family phage protein n=1 Tax=Clostridium sp. HBUAS56010 TaxID=2571127 RepID=UPI001178ABE1|nr:HK97 gp10 family phage protein [Clostridium sp. HBUAS56010]DAJ05447.1 MAG TPA: hypothetical protein [Caudoviricetes sp.]
MSTFGQATRKRMEQLRKQGQNVPAIMAEVMEGATIAAVERATELTPPNGSAIFGTGTRTGDLAQHWELDSITKPVVSGGNVRTSLANNMQYASYVNDGHRMDEHFVPGLIVNGGVLEKVDPSLGGITVGTKTPYVQGKYMKQAGIGRYKNVVRLELDKRVKENFK